MMKKIYTLILTLLVVSSSAFAQKNLIFVGPTLDEVGNKDIQALTAIKDHGGFTVTELVAGTLLESDLADLNAADVVIMGRSIGSTDVAASVDLWDQITSPVLSMCLWGIRSNRALWFNSESVHHYEVDAAAILQGTILVSDPVFGDKTGAIDWWVGNYDVFDEVGVDYAGNGTLMAATAEGFPLFARWEAGKEFYTGSGRTPQGPRTYMGLGLDSAEPYNYFGFSDDAKAIFFAELERMASGATPVDNVNKENPNLSVYVNNSVLSITMPQLDRVEIYSLAGKMMLSESAEGNNLKLTPSFNKGIYIVKAFDSEGSVTSGKFLLR